MSSLPLYPTLLADPHYEGIGTNGRPEARWISVLLKMRDALHRVTPARVRKHRITQREAVMAFADHRPLCRETDVVPTEG